MRALQRRTIATRVVRHRFKAGDTRRRMRIMFVVSAALLVAVLGRVVYLQTARSATLVAAGTAQRTSETVLKAGRGTIFDRTGAEMAISVPRTTLFANPKLVSDAAGTANVLATVLGLSSERQQALQDAFTTKEKTFVYVARQVDETLASSVSALKLPGIDSYEEDQRVLPSGVGSSVVGQTDIDGHGTAGLEKQFDNVLTGTDGQRVREHDSQGRSIPGSDATTTAPVPGDDLQLTLDRSLQYQVEQALIDGINRPTVMAKGASAVVMDVTTGEVLAIANVVRGDDGVARVTWANNAAVSAHEPGSVAKVFSIAASLNEGVTTPDTSIVVPPYLIFDKGTKYQHIIYDAESHPTMAMTLHDILVESSNIGTWLTAKQMTPDTLAGYLHRFGFGEPTGLGFPGESDGLIRPGDEWLGTEKATATYGYGYSATSLQLAAAVNTIANGGTYVAPKLVKATVDSSGALVDTAPSATHQVVTPKTASEMNLMMRDVICSDKGTAHRGGKIPGMTASGKTGTAYKVQKGGGYVGADGELAYYASFVGFFPADAPKLTVLVSVDQPDPTSNDRFGGTASAPIFVDIAEAAIHELQISPSAGDTGCATSAS